MPSALLFSLCCKKQTNKKIKSKTKTLYPDHLREEDCDLWQIKISAKKKSLFIQPKNGSTYDLSHIFEAWHASCQAPQPKAVHTDEPLCINWHLHECGIPKINISTSGARWHSRWEMSNSDMSMSTQPLSERRRMMKGREAACQTRPDFCRVQTLLRACMYAYTHGTLQPLRCPFALLGGESGRRGVVIFEGELTLKKFPFVSPPHLSGRSRGSQKGTEGTCPSPSTEIIKPPHAW